MELESYKMVLIDLSDYKESELTEEQLKEKALQEEKRKEWDKIPNWSLDFFYIGRKCPMCDGKLSAIKQADYYKPSGWDGLTTCDSCNTEFYISIGDKMGDGFDYLYPNEEVKKFFEKYPTNKNR